MKLYDRGTAIYIYAVLRDVSEERIDPTSIAISIIDPNAQSKKNEEAMTKVETGRYAYIWQSAANDAVGAYTVTIKAVSGTYTSINKLVLFELE